jgi:CRISPR-associated protein Cas5h
MVACVLGYDRDSYYESFSSERCKVGLQLKKGVRRALQTVNYLMTDRPLTLEKLKGIGAPAQVHTELVLAEGDILSELRYRVFWHHDDDGSMKELESRLTSRRFHYPPSLGTANSLGVLDYVQTLDAEVFRSEAEVDVSTVVATSLVESLSPSEDVRIYVEELVPADFSRDRTLRRKETYIYEGSGRPIRIRANAEVFKCMIDGEEVVGTFL